MVFSRSIIDLPLIRINVPKVQKYRFFATMQPSHLDLSHYKGPIQAKARDVLIHVQFKTGTRRLKSFSSAILSSIPSNFFPLHNSDVFSHAIFVHGVSTAPQLHKVAVH
jgi:hypothetical protein